MSTPTLRWLQIHQYEQFEPVRIEFSERENLILGLNGAGKTQLLKLIWAVLTLNFRELGEQELHVEFELVSEEGPPEAPVIVSGRVRTRVEPGFGDDIPSGPRTRSSSGLEASLLFRSGASVFQFELNRGEAKLLDEDGATLATGRDDRGVLLPHSFAMEWTTAPERIDVFFDMRPRSGCCFFGEEIAEFRALVNEIEFELRYSADRARPGVRIHSSKLAAINPRLLWDLASAAFKIASAYEHRKSGPGIVPEQLGLDPQELLKPLGATGLWFLPEKVREADQTIDCRGIRLWLRFPGGEVRDSEFTFGQKRYLYASLVSLLLRDFPVVCDEIDNGMHPRLVLALLEMWSDRQVFVASHNQLVIDSTNFYSPADVREKIHIVRRRDDGRQVVKVFDDEVAREFHAAIEVKIQRPSEVLEAEGLW